MLAVTSKGMLENTLYAQGGSGTWHDVTLADLHARCLSKSRSQVARQKWVLLDGDHRAAQIGQAICHDARTSAKIKYQLAGLYG